MGLENCSVQHKNLVSLHYSLLFEVWREKWGEVREVKALRLFSGIFF